MTDDLPRILRANATWLYDRGPFPKAVEACRMAADEIERLEKLAFKYETALMLIGEGIPEAASLAKAALTLKPQEGPP